MNIFGHLEKMAEEDFQDRWGASYWHPGSPMQKHHAAISQDLRAKLADFTCLQDRTYNALFVRPSDGATIEIVEHKGDIVRVRELSTEPKLRCHVLNVSLLKAFWTRTG